MLINPDCFFKSGKFPLFKLHTFRVNDTQKGLNKTTARLSHNYFACKWN